MNALPTLAGVSRCICRAAAKGNYESRIEGEKEEKKRDLVPMRIELMTSALLARRSNQLS